MTFVISPQPPDCRESIPVRASGPPVRKVPGWVTVAAILACLGGAGWLAWTLWSRPASGTRVETLPRDPGDYVKRENANEWTVRVAPDRRDVALAVVTISRKPGEPAGEGPPDVVFAIRPERQKELLAPEQIEVLTALKAVVDGEPRYAGLGLSAEQMSQLAAIRERRLVPLKLDPSDEQRIRTLFAAYEPLERAAGQAMSAAVEVRDAGDPARRQAADRAQADKLEAVRRAEDDLCEAAEDVTRRKVPLFRKDAAERAAAARAVFTPEQWKKVQELKAAAPDPAPRRGRGRGR